MNYEKFNTNWNKPSIFTAQTYGTKTSVEIDHSDLDLDEVMNAFETLVVGMGYHKDAWKGWIIEKSSQYHDEDTEDLKHKLNDWKNDDEEESSINQNEWNKRRDSLADIMENYINVPIHYFIDESGQKQYDIEEMREVFESKLSAYDTTLTTTNNILIDAEQQYNEFFKDKKD
jgi:hypothetical protein